MVLIRILAIALVFQTVVFVSLWFYARARRRERLEAEWQISGREGSLESHLSKDVAAFNAALKRKLLWGVYVIPSMALTLLIYLTSSD